ncbi:lysophospholipase,putative [Plasmodium sp. gorilla clade G2]|uniref:lysophospholipase,putative n=1 Tax=Plasmodium sp. gorilla clade G2 TaxID=880535 RepID=UPI000D210B46|nr:lysophospholipase,putative [Plasmodium sp. gorilla clade G2]SOV17167.1 lysophospholipase,putative [Plasmodium sp. gorilla clade G2]
MKNENCKALEIIILVHGIVSHIRLGYLKHNVNIINNPEALLNDYKEVNRDRKHDEGDINIVKPPIYLMGLSMGGNIVLRVLETLGRSKQFHEKLYIKGYILLSSMI